MKKNIAKKILTSFVVVAMSEGLLACSVTDNIEDAEVVQTEMTNSEGQLLDLRFVGTWCMLDNIENPNGFVLFTYVEDGTGHYEYYMSSSEAEVEADPSIEPDKALNFVWYVENGTIYMDNHKNDEENILELAYRFDGDTIVFDEDEDDDPMIFYRR